PQSHCRPGEGASPPGGRHRIGTAVVYRPGRACRPAGIVCGCGDPGPGRIPPGSRHLLPACRRSVGCGSRSFYHHQNSITPTVILHRVPHLLLTLMLLVVSAAAVAQSIPQGMKYQAVARDPRGQVLANTSLQLDVKLYSDPAVREIAYSELHKVTTNELGLFSLTI